MMPQRTAVFLFRIAALHNLGAALLLILVPQTFFRWFSLPELNHPFLMQGVGVLIAVYGVCYLLLSMDPPRYRLLAVPGLIAKCLGAAAWALWTAAGALPLSAYWLSAVNDLLWIPLLLLFLRSSRTSSSDSGAVRL